MHHLINAHQWGSRVCSLPLIWSQSVPSSWCVSVFHCSLLTVALGCDIHGLRNHVIESLGMLEKMSDSIATMVPLQVLADIDNSRNPMLLTKERLERAATENQFMNGKIHASEVSVLLSALFVQVRPAPGDGLAVVGRRIRELCG